MVNDIKNPFKELKILSEADATELVEMEPKQWNVVSIWSGGGGKHGNSQPLHKKAKTMCQHRFHDINKEADGLILCNKWHIECILDYAKKHYDDKMIIHCHAGISRSSAFAFLILLDYIKDMSDNPVSDTLHLLVETKSHNLIIPNKHIIGLGMSVLCDGDFNKEISWNRELYNHRIFSLLYNGALRPF